MDIYVSTLALQGHKVEEMIELARANHWALEFSSGLPYRKDMTILYKDADIKKIPHNYFPAPQVPFVLNLASADNKIRKQSLKHCKDVLRMAKQSDSPFFAAHAGFCVDPKPTELGNKINYTTVFNKEYNKKIFIESVYEILQLAEELEIDFLIENNVIAPFNIVDGVNPLLCCGSEEISWLFTTISHRHLGLLLDTAHLKVSCQTLGLNLLEEFEKIKTFIKAFHHSDNDSFSDNNKMFKEDYWILPMIYLYKKDPHIIEVKNINPETINKQINLLKEYGC